MSKAYNAMTKAELIKVLQDRDERLVKARTIYSEMRLRIEMLSCEIGVLSTRLEQKSAERLAIKGEPTKFESLAAAVAAAKEWVKDRSIVVTQVGTTVFKKPRAQA